MIDIFLGDNVSEVFIFILDDTLFTVESLDIGK